MHLSPACAGAIPTPSGKEVLVVLIVIEMSQNEPIQGQGPEKESKWTNLGQGIPQNESNGPNQAYGPPKRSQNGPNQAQGPPKKEPKGAKSALKSQKYQKYSYFKRSLCGLCYISAYILRLKPENLFGLLA